LELRKIDLLTIISEKYIKKNRFTYKLSRNIFGRIECFCR